MGKRAELTFREAVTVGGTKNRRDDQATKSRELSIRAQGFTGLNNENLNSPEVGYTTATYSLCL